jgi:hypothetical protein
MKHFALLSFVLISFVLVQAQPPKIEAKSGMSFGKSFEPAEAMDINKALEGMVSDEPRRVIATGTVTEVCKAEGCWIKLATEKGSVLVKMKDHAFVVPLSLSGKQVAIRGTGQIKETSVDMLKHYAEDAGKSKEEIDAIKEPKREAIIYAEGIIVQ